MLKFKQRFVNNALLESISRPQDAYNCSLASLTAVINYLFVSELGINTMDKVADTLGFTSRNATDIINGPTNEEFQAWFSKYLEINRVKGASRIAFDATSIAPVNSDANRRVLAQIQSNIRSKDKVLVYHCENHYCLVCGYFECSNDPVAAYEDGPAPVVWIVLGDHSPVYPPVRSVRWREIRQDFIGNQETGTGHCFLLFERS